MRRGRPRRHFPEREPVARVPFSLTSEEALRSLLQDAGFGLIDVARIAASARFSSPEEFTRSFMEGSPMALAMADVPAEQREALARDIAESVRKRIGDPVVAPMVTHIATARL